MTAQSSTKKRRNRIPARHRKRIRSSTRRKCCVDGVPNKRAIVATFLETLHMIKLYHWNTVSYSQHKATDELHERLTKNTDKFVEVFLGKHGTRLYNMNTKLHLYNIQNAIDLKKRVLEFKHFLIDMTHCLDKDGDTDLLNIRDEMLTDLNQFLYLLTLDK
jgi:hypothetical protein